MPIVVTINGQVGSGGRDVGAVVARKLHVDYVDQHILREAAQRLGTCVEELPAEEFFTLSLRERLSRMLQRALYGSALASTGEVFPSLDIVMGRSYEETTRPASTQVQEVDDAGLLEVLCVVMRDLARHGDVVIVGRGSHIVLQDVPGVLHVGFVAPFELRVRRLVEREGLAWREAERRAHKEERARVAFFQKFYRVDPDHPDYYDITLNLGRLSVDEAAGIVVHQARRMR